MVLSILVLDELKVKFPSTCIISGLVGEFTEDVFPSTCKISGLVDEETEDVLTSNCGFSDLVIDETNTLFPPFWKMFGFLLQYLGACSASEQLSADSSLTRGRTG